jgi:hypothetical protein
VLQSFGIKIGVYDLLSYMIVVGFLVHGCAVFIRYVVTANKYPGLNLGYCSAFFDQWHASLLYISGMLVPDCDDEIL